MDQPKIIMKKGGLTNPGFPSTTGMTKVDSPSMQMAQSAMINGNFSNPALVGGLPPVTMATGVGANPHQFPTPLANQNGGLTSAGSSKESDQHVVPQSLDQPTAPGQGQGQSSDQEQQTSNLANIKEKTPMCLINELARYNRVTHQYTLVDEQGPAHKKVFYVKLQLGDSEDYSASGPSIKKAQHSAAAIALEKTSFKHPPPKPIRPMPSYLQCMTEPVEGEDDLNSIITPTVELNSLAMKRGEPAVYKSLDNKNPHPFNYQPPNFDFRGMYNQRYHYMRVPRTYYVSLKVGQREFIGEGNTRQSARHCAATKALRVLRSLPLPAEKPEEKTGAETEEEDKDKSKSEISSVHEIALKHNLPVTFDVVREAGPPHMKNFVTRCVVGTFSTEAEGNSKKVSKKRAAELMLQELKALPPITPTTLRPKPKQPVNKKKNRNLIKMQKSDPSYGVGINPISRLIQIQQAQKKKEPVYTLLAERGLPRRREFVMQVLVDDQTCTGIGPNKKLAKRHAAESMLLQLGYNKPSPQPSKSAIKLATENSPGDKKVTFSENREEQASPIVNGQGGRQMVPGLLVLPEGNRTGVSSNYSSLKGMSSPYQPSSMMQQGYPLRPELQLREVASKHNIDVHFDEFAGKNNVNEYLSRLMIGSHPQQILHGTGATADDSRDAAALTALKLLAEKGLVQDDPMKPSGDASPLAGGIDLMANSKMAPMKME